MENNPVPKWYALSVYTRQERAAYEEIRGLGVESFWPTAQVRRLWSDRVKRIEQSLFPGYLFVRLELDPEARIRLIRLNQVVDFVGKSKSFLASGYIAASIPDSQIDSLKILMQSKDSLEPISQLVSGTEVMISQGSLKGVWGIILKEPNGKKRVVVQVPLLGRGISVELPAEEVLCRRELGLSA